MQRANRQRARCHPEHARSPDAPKSSATGPGWPTAVAAATQASGSLIISLALVHGHITTEEAAAASQLDETWQNQKWGEDPEQTERLEALKKEIRAVAVLIKLTDDFI